MLRALTVGFLVVGLGGAAIAADVPSGPLAAPVAVPGGFDWTGFYFGAQVGAGWGSSSWTTPSTRYSIDWDQRGFFGGLHAGYNRQVGAFVLGVQGDVDFAGLDGDKRDVNYNVRFKTDQNWLASIDLRAGWALDRTLIYGIGGAAFTTASHSIANLSGVPSHQYDGNRIGWNLGGGAEYALDPKWSLRAEYRYTDFGKADFAQVQMGSGVVYAHDYSVRAQTVRAGVSYHF
ncbi:porin family protein [Siculibacillus lacustris]|uniref:Porin family protein n=1 Tax=Siculibacillus lacustris TaxID=1549641 RepID=A0A4Q9VN48_9HYPH|nr:outer membrane protein [Siculibacillus lacustris]TBW36963.1 porin family protein [Siculibacillus lacustris]